MGDYDFFANKKPSGISKRIGASLFRKLMKTFLLALPSQASNILEIGTGEGTFALTCRDDHSFNYTGYEPNKTMCTRLTNLGFKIHNIKTPPLLEENATQDAVALINVLEHSGSCIEALEIAKESFRVLKTNGIIFISVPDFLSWGKDFYNHDYTHTFPTTEIRVQQLLTDAGFSDIHIQWYWGDLFNDAGRFLNFAINSLKSSVSLFVPRKISRSVRFQKMGMLYSANILVIGKKRI